MAVICSVRRQWYKNCLFELAQGRIIRAAAGQSHVPLANCNQPFSFLGRRHARPPAIARSHLILSHMPRARASYMNSPERRMSQGFGPLGTLSNFSFCHSCEKTLWCLGVSYGVSFFRKCMTNISKVYFTPSGLFLAPPAVRYEF